MKTAFILLIIGIFLILLGVILNTSIVYQAFTKIIFIIGLLIEMYGIVLLYQYFRKKYN